MLFKEKTKRVIPEKTRKRAIEMLRHGDSVSRIVSQLHVSTTTVKRWRAELNKEKKPNG